MIALARPEPTALVLVLIVGVWAIVAVVVEFSAAFASGESAGTRAMFILGGLVTIAFGVVLCARLLTRRDRPLPGISGAPRRSTGDGSAIRSRIRYSQY